MSGVLLGCPLWGDRWIDRFLAYCLPSIMEPENRAALHGRSRILIYTNAEGFHRLARHGVLELHELPTGVDKWAVLTEVQKSLLKEAAKSGMGTSALQPDIVFPQGYFARLLRLGQTHEAIVGLGIWANAETVLREFAIRRRNGFLSIPSRELGEIGWYHLHPVWRRYMMNGVNMDTAMPGTHLLSWLGVDSIRNHCSHVNALWLSPRLCALARPTNTLDAALADILGGVVPYVPDVSDGLAPLEFAEPGDKTNYFAPGKFKRFAEHWWRNAPNLDLFKLPMLVPIEPRMDGMTDAEIDVQLSSIVGRLTAMRAAA